MTAPASRIAEVVAEGRRLEESAAFVGRESVPWEEFSDAGARVEAFYTEHGPALLAVAEAAVEWEAADAEQRRVPAWSRDTDLFERMLFRSQSATRALRAAVRGEEKTNG